MCIVVDRRISLKAVARGTPTVSSGRKAAVPSASRQVFGTPPGSKSGACIHRGNSGTWESHLSPCHMAGMGDRQTKSPGVARELPPGYEPETDTTNAGSRQGIGSASDKRSDRRWVGVVDCNRNAPGLQSARFQDHIICIYPCPQDHIIGV